MGTIDDAFKIDFSNPEFVKEFERLKKDSPDRTYEEYVRLIGTILAVRGLAKSLRRLAKQNPKYFKY